MNAATEPGYLTDVEYTGDFYRFLAPAWLAYIASVNGYSAPRLDSGFTYCELGCGKGLTSLALAALHPNGEFHACDFNAAHIDYAEGLRRAAGTSNVRFYPHSFARMMDQDLPQFDFIVLHGVYSWVPAAARAEIHEFLRRRLRPGGLALVSYNAMPGWAHLQPIRHLMQVHAEAVAGDTFEKARAAFAYIDSLANKDAGFFRAVPAAAGHLKFMAQQDIRYIAHEYLTQNGDAFYFRQVHDAMRDAGLAFAGSMFPKDNYVELMVPPRFQDLLARSPSRVLVETDRDIIENSTFRQDLYAAQPAVERSGVIAPEDLGTGVFCLPTLPDDPAAKRNDQAFKLDSGAEAQRLATVQALMTPRPASIQEIRAALPDLDDAGLSGLLQRLVVAQRIAPCPPVRPLPGWLPLNGALVEAGLAEQQQKVCLACPSTGSGTYCEVVYAAAIEAAATQEDGHAAARRVLARLRAHRHPVNKVSTTGERRAASDVEVLEYVSGTWRMLREGANRDARLLRMHGVLR